VEQLELPEPFDAEAFIGLLARERGRPIDLLPVADLPDLPCGLVVTTRDSDWIVYRADTTRLHRQHILLHEAAPIRCGHSERGGDGLAHPAPRPAAGAAGRRRRGLALEPRSAVRHIRRLIMSDLSAYLAAAALFGYAAYRLGRGRRAVLQRTQQYTATAWSAAWP
jgi:hypothetical protein